MGRLSQAVIDKIVDLHTMKGMDAEEISEELEVGIKAVNRVLSVLEEVKDEVEPSDEEEASIDWKSRYLEAHVKLIENGIE